MKHYGFILVLFFASLQTIGAQCSTLIQMVNTGIEGCVLPVIVDSNVVLLPCSAPQAFYALEEGDYAYIDYQSTSCINICQFGQDVDITCFTGLTSIRDDLKNGPLHVFPTPADSWIRIEGQDLQQVEIFDAEGILVSAIENLTPAGIDISALPSGVYFAKVKTHDFFRVIPFIKK